MAATISLCMIVRNEEKVLARCLESVRGCVDEIIIVDTGSSDGTKEIAARFTDKIYDFEWIDDFSAARNYSFEQATGDYLLWLDADDVLLPADAEALLRFKAERLADCNVVMLRYNSTPVFKLDKCLKKCYYTIVIKLICKFSVLSERK